MEEIEFPFPFKPYDIQQKFMKELYLTLEKRGLGIFESPTGTGKSLSICCGALQWLKDHVQKEEEQLEKSITQLKSEISSQTSNDDWLQEEYEKIKKTQVLAELNSKLDHIKKRRTYFSDLKSRVAKQKANLSIKESVRLKDFSKKYDKEKENINEENKEPIAEDHDLILEEFEEKECSDDEETEEKLNYNNTKIYISSRTHSQLSQFVGEIKRTVFNEDTRVVTLASRQHYCINPDVAKLKNVHLINERCLDMQKSSTKSTAVDEDGKVLKKTKTKSCTACPYYNQSNVTKLKERLLVDIMDMEDLLKNGKELKGCPYYASRAALEDAQVVLLSHAGIVSAGAREGVSLQLDNNILILDEAHGLTAALESAHSAPVTDNQLTAVNTFLKFYINKYRARLSSRNLLCLNQLSFVVGKLCGIIKSKTDAKKEEDTTIFTVEDYVIKAEIDHINLRPLIEFCKATRLAQKLHGFSMRYNQQMLEDEAKKVEVKKKSSLEAFLKNISKKKVEEEVKVPPVVEEKPVAQAPTSAGTALYALLELLRMLSSRCSRGRVSLRRALLRYELLDATAHFTDVVTRCRSVVVAGGTMEPIAEFQSLLTGGDPSLRDVTTTSHDVITARRDVTVVRCDHVVPAENVLAVCLSKGPSNLSLNFSYESRQSKPILDELGRILRNVCNIVPGGVICFLPSYSYEQTIHEHLKTGGVLDVIGKKKKVFREPKNASDVEQVLQKYALAVKNKDNGNTGALLLSVVGGKLSEGLNFSDALGRCVLVAGMPYPNSRSPELQEKMKYLNRSRAGAGNEYYENLCMKAVNQCIGRAVRHVNDYACVLLVDERYSRPHTVSALPTFVQKSLTTNANFGPTIGSIAKFFTRHKDNVK
ncbi:hypothetical protein JYU34_006542 [Plutella xylostella]|uniref:Helicase ATP-binding domain-containing protein n=1 Tax=Plutella xylostella TaxID=51655 RepID=A0ABQ7QSE4_PLUXY|nr:hypothetical protein JYU34_006542 [Plutella xylostella]